MAVAVLAAGSAAALLVSARADDGAGFPRPRPGAVPLAVLGDSDSHAYQDFILIPDGAGKRGGKYRRSTWQWTEALARLRGETLDQGEWGMWGSRFRIAQALEWLGWDGRAPRKQDFEYNFAVSGAQCADLMGGDTRQARRLRALMDRDPGKWRDGVVLVRIGVNTIGQNSALERFAREGPTPEVRSEVLGCARAIGSAVEWIRERHPHTRFVLVGTFDNSNLPENVARWTAPPERANIAAVLDVFDEALRAIAAREPRIAFFDDRAWFRKHWGERGTADRPAYRSVNLGGERSVANTQGDEPTNAVLADRHAGAVWNALWARDLVALLNNSFAARIPPVSIEEVARLVDPGGEFGLRPVGR